VLVAAAPAPAEAAGRCSFVTVSGVAFGAYSVFSPSALDSDGSITFQCNPGASGSTVRITLSAGGSQGFVQRRMSSGGEHLGYNLFLDPARSTVWGDGTGGTAVFTVTLPSSGWSTITQPIYGRVPARQDVGAGDYLDSILVTMNW
jgi:spore coat protein U-like protein